MMRKGVKRFESLLANRVTIALVLSFVLHLLLLSGGFSTFWAKDDDRPEELTTVELVPVEALPISPPQQQPIPEPETQESRTPEFEAQRRPSPPQVAAISRKTHIVPMETEPIEPLEEEPIDEPEIVVELAPTKLPRIPTPRDAARRQIINDLPPPPTEREHVEGRVLAITRGALRPRLNDQSPLPELVPDGRGNLVHESGALKATIAPDGTVSFGRRRGIDVEGFHNKSPDPDEQAILDLFTRLPGVPMLIREASPADCARGECEDKGGLGITFRPRSDLNDAILRAKGDDPLAARKRRFLRLTKELREGLSESHRKLVLSRSKIRVSRNLERLWSNKELSFATKRRLIFQLWDESEEPSLEMQATSVATEEEGNGGEHPEGKAGQRARAFIVRFIGQRLPAQGAEAYSVEELRGLNNGRASLEEFAPYR